MTEILKCPFCGEKLQTHTMTPGRTLICVNKGCPVDSAVMKRIVWQALIDGKKAQEDLECMKHNYSVVSEQKEIAYQNYLKITGNLQTQLQKVQDELKKTQAGLYCGHCVKTAEVSQRWSEAIFFAKNFISHGINSDVANYSESNCRWALSEIDKILSETTKQYKGS